MKKNTQQPPRNNPGPVAASAKQAPATDMVNHPPHYTNHPSGVECIQITEHMTFNVGNAIKYLWRAYQKGAPIQDLKKAAFYVNREIELREKQAQ